MSNPAALRLIASGAYVGQELTAEFGRLPPSFLPLGVERLYQRQHALFEGADPVVLSVPESYQLSTLDDDHLRRLGVQLVLTPDGLSLGESLLYVINSLCATLAPVQLLHGDTLLAALPTMDGDVIAVGEDSDDYSWAEVELAAGRIVKLRTEGVGDRVGDRPVAVGYFQFDSSAELARCITHARGDFITALNLYGAARPFRPAPAAGWSDFGHIQTYFRSRRAVTTARAFNTLSFRGDVVRKASADGAKMRAEAAWLRDCPAGVKLYAARLLAEGDEAAGGAYEIEYRHAPTVAELNVFSLVGRATWRRIAAACQAFLSACADAPGPGSADAALSTLAVGKTLSRLETFARATGFKIDAPLRMAGRSFPSLVAVAERLAAAIDLGTGRSETVMHGDFCFSNILYDSRAGRITVIDPRGQVGEELPTLFGDPRYDLAKLRHSVFGRYDHIIAGRYRLLADGSDHPALEFEASPHQSWLEGAAAELTAGPARGDELSVRAIAAGLFLSMLPLHADRPDRQTAFVSNALRLFDELEGAR